MKFVKLHQSGEEVLVNMSTVSEVYRAGDNKSRSQLYFNFTDDDGGQFYITVDESLDEIYEKVKGSGDA